MTIDLTGLVRPQLVEMTKREDNPNAAEFRLQPLERGFGYTLGNGLRRMLLSSLRGSAVWAFRMDGVHAMDVTGLVAFESAIEELSDHKQRVFLVGVHPQPLGLLRRSDMLEDPQFVQVCKTMGEAVLQASEHLQGIGISTN